MSSEVGQGFVSSRTELTNTKLTITVFDKTLPETKGGLDPPKAHQDSHVAEGSTRKHGDTLENTPAKESEPETKETFDPILHPLPIASDEDFRIVAKLLGRKPYHKRFKILLRRDDRSPVVVENEPLVGNSPDKLRPFPTRYWLVDPRLRRAIDALEFDGGVKQSERDIPAEEVRQCHEAHARERNANISSLYRRPRPHGGVAGTRMGVKCLHAHYANFLVCGTDPVGQWVHERLTSVGEAFGQDISGEV